jgi:hypothetical protein
LILIDHRNTPASENADVDKESKPKPLELLVTNEAGVKKEISTTATNFNTIKKHIVKAFYPDAPRKIKELKKMPEGTVLSTTEELKGKSNI